MRILMVSDVYFPRVNGVSTSIETFRRTLAEHGIEVRLVVPRYGDEAEEAGVVRVAGRPVPGDREDRLVGWRALHRPLRRAQGGTPLGSAGGRDLSHAVRGVSPALCAVFAVRLAEGAGAGF